MNKDSEIGCGKEEKGKAREGGEDKVGTRTLSIRALKAKLNTEACNAVKCPNHVNDFCQY